MAQRGHQTTVAALSLYAKVIREQRPITLGVPGAA